MQSLIILKKLNFRSIQNLFFELIQKTDRYPFFGRFMNQEWICCFNRVEKVVMCVYISQSEITQFVGIVKLILSKNHHFK